MSLQADLEDRVRFYTERAAQFAAQAEQLESRSRLISNFRGVSFAVFVISSGVAFFGGPNLVANVLAILGFISFAALVFAHQKIISARDSALRWQLVNQRGIARCQGGWREFPESGASFRDPAHPYAEDLDVFGEGSLFQRINVAHTRYGQQALYRFLAEPSDLKSAAQRQEAVRQLVAERELRQSLEASALALIPEQRLAKLAPSARAAAYQAAPDPELLLEWAESEPRLGSSAALRILRWALPLLNLAAVLGVWLGDLSRLVLILPLGISFVVTLRVAGEAGRVFTAVSATEGAFLRYAPMLELLEGLKLDAPYLRRLQQGLRAGDEALDASADSGRNSEQGWLRPSVAMQEFKRKVGWFDLRYNALLHPILNLLLLWDLHCVLALESWQKRAGYKVRAWFSALGELEALSSLAGYAHDEPQHAWPQLMVAPGEGEAACAPFVAQQLGHPLIELSSRVTNDVRLPAPGTALLITGSNMSGKSTLMRSMGLAIVMARAGGPVCAGSLQLSPLILRTSIRISDSLGSGVSHFYAEVSKLKAVLDASERLGSGRAADKAEPPTPKPERAATPHIAPGILRAGEFFDGEANNPQSLVFFLLDEILHGTNSRERQVGARWVLAELLTRGAVGAVSTHDMGLCQLTPELMDRVTQVHLRESVEEGRMTFDYRLRQGPVKSGNALRLMQLVGLGVPLDGPAEPEDGSAPV